MAARKAFALRMDEKTLAAVQRWANDDLRSLIARGVAEIKAPAEANGSGQGLAARGCSSAKITSMHSALPFLLILLAVFTAGCIAYIAWELSSGKQDSGRHNSKVDEQDPN
jgi:hypothetical protein